MSLLIDLFGYLSIVVHGLVIIAQSMMLGGMLFLVLLARPFASEFPAGPGIRDSAARIAAWSALGLIAAEGATVAMQTAVLVGTVDLPVWNVLGANFAIAGLVKITAAAVLGLLLLVRAPGLLLIAAGLVELVAATFTTHAEARLADNDLLLGVEALHQLGAAIWIGGIPTFVMALARVHDARAWRRIGERFSRMSMAGVAAIVVSGAVMAWFYIGSWAGFYGTAYGVMVGAKIAMLLMLLALGYGNFRSTGRLRADPGASVVRMKRFAEVEIGIGFSIFFAAASLTSVPPAIDLPQDRVSWHEIVERNAPVVPRLVSPDHSSLALIQLQDRLDRQAVHDAYRGGAGLRAGLGRDAAAQCGRHRLVGIQPPLGRALRRRDRAARAAQPGGGKMGAALAARVPRPRRVPVPAFGPGSMAARHGRHHRLAARRGGGAAPHLRGC